MVVEEGLLSSALEPLGRVNEGDALLVLAHKGLVVDVLRATDTEVVLGKGSLTLSGLLQQWKGLQVRAELRGNQPLGGTLERPFDVYASAALPPHTKSQCGSGVRCSPSPSRSACSDTRKVALCLLLCTQHGPRLQCSLTEDRCEGVGVGVGWCEGGGVEVGREGQCDGVGVGREGQCPEQCPAHQRMCCSVQRRGSCSPAHYPGQSLDALAEM